MPTPRLSRNADCPPSAAHWLALVHACWLRLHSSDCYLHVLAALRVSSLHDDEADEADVTDDSNAKIVAKGLADLDSIAQSKVRHLAGLDCTATQQHTMSVISSCKTSQASVAGF